MHEEDTEKDVHKIEDEYQGLRISVLAKMKITLSKFCKSFYSIFLFVDLLNAACIVLKRFTLIFSVVTRRGF